jgi:hypothetical protein
MRASPLLASPTLRSGSFALLPSLSETEPPEVIPLTGVASSLPRACLVLFTAQRPRRALQPLPLSHIPAPAGTALACHSLHDLSLPHAGIGAPHRAFLPGLTSAFVHGAVRGYTDPRGREAEPGTYDALHRLLFTPHPAASLSRGGPLIDASTGAVVGVVGGARLDFDTRPLGWGVPAEAIFEVGCRDTGLAMRLTDSSLDVRVAWPGRKKINESLLFHQRTHMTYADVGITASSITTHP